MIKDKTPTPAASLYLRAASRLRSLLSDIGHPVDALGRATSLAKATGLSKQAASNLMSGIVPWTLDDVAVLCETFGKTAGFFLDPGPDQLIPADSIIVTSSDGGESTVWRAPGGFLESPRTFPKQPLRYISTSSPGYFDASLVRTMLVYEDWSGIDAHAPVVKNSGYVIEDAIGSLRPMRCLDVNNNVAVFTSRDKGGPDRVIVPVNLQLKANVGVHLVGKVIGAIQGF